MARKRMVTRTITFTTAKATVYVISSNEIKTAEYKLPGALPADVALEVIAKKYPEVRPLAVTEVKVQEELYGMLEEKFIEHADILPARTKVSE